MYKEQTGDACVDCWDHTGAEPGASAIELFIQRMEGLDAQRRRARHVGPHGRNFPRNTGSDHRSKTAERIDLVLYTSASSQKSQKALRAVRDVLEQYDASQVKFTVYDLSKRDGSPPHRCVQRAGRRGETGRTDCHRAHRARCNNPL